MFWIICFIAFIAAILIGLVWGNISLDDMRAGATICGLVAIGAFMFALLIVASFGPKEGASSIDYVIENVGGDMYYVDDRGSHEVDSVRILHFGDVKRPTYRVTTYSLENWPHFPDAELLIPEGSEG